MGLIVSLVVLGTGCSPVFAQSQQYPTNEQLNVLDLAATAGWINTKVYVKRGWRVKISARGRWSNGNYTRSDRTVFRPFYGPDGFSDTSDPTNELLVPTTLVGSLIGRIGNSQPFAIGSNLTFVAANDGWLYLSMNDKPETFNDNQGSLNVTVQYTSNQTTTGRSLLLQEQGVLAKGDSVLSSDGSLYDQYNFQGSAGQGVTITVESAEFDTYVAIITPDGKLLAENDDINQSNKNAGLTVTLPSNGTYRVIVNGYDNNSRGRYAVSVSTPTQQTVTGQSPSPNQQTATRTIQPVIQTFSSVKSLGMAQFLRGTTELKSAQETLQKAARGEYDTITNGQKTDFLEDILEDIPEIRPVDCKSFGFSCESKEITYADYLNLKLKVYLQIGVFKNGMKVYDEIPKYQNRLFQDQRYGGLNVGQNLTSEWEKRWNNVKEQQRLKDKQANLPITERLGVVMEQTIKDTANFSWELFKTSTKVAATLAQIKDLAETITSLTSINQYNLNRIAPGA